MKITNTKYRLEIVLDLCLSKVGYLFCVIDRNVHYHLITGRCISLMSSRPQGCSFPLGSRHPPPLLMSDIAPAPTSDTCLMSQWPAGDALLDEVAKRYNV